MKKGELSFYNEKTVGYIKFIDSKYIDSYYFLSDLWLTDFRYFVKHFDSSLIYDLFEGSSKYFSLDMPAFFTCFTKLSSDSFDSSGILKSDIVSSLLSVDNGGTDRNFIFISVDNMKSLYKCLFNLSDNEGFLKNTEFFFRDVCYLKNYSSYMENFDSRMISSDFELLDEFGEAALATKDYRYHLQNEFRIGIVLPCKYTFFKEKYLKDNHGITVCLNETISFACEIFDRSILKNLNKEYLLDL